MADETIATSDDRNADEDTLGFGGVRGARRPSRVVQPSEPSTATKKPTPNAYHRQRSFDAGDLPEGMEARYLIERRRLTGEQRYYENASDTKPAFRDRGDRLVADNDSRDLIRDMLDIAEHRGWDRVRVSGSEVFRRAAWREAALRGIEVDGYTPRPRELQEVERARARRDARAGTIAADIGPEPKVQRGGVAGGPDDGKDHRARRADFDTGVTGRLADIGAERGANRSREDSSINAGVQPDAGRRAEKRDSNVALADRFRNATSAEAARDPALMAAQSQFVAAKAIVGAILSHDPAAADRLVARSRETIARAIEQGRAIPPAELRGDRRVEPERNRPNRERARDDAGSRDVATVTKAPTRTRAR